MAVKRLGIQTKLDSRKRTHKDKNSFRGKSVKNMNQNEKNKLLQTLAEIAGLI